jgi:hypothetical protein
MHAVYDALPAMRRYSKEWRRRTSSTAYGHNLKNNKFEKRTEILKALHGTSLCVIRS